jgi:diacylglycerol kinase (ATP)
MQAARKAIVIHSPHAGRADRLAEALRQLEEHGVQVVENTSISNLDDLPPQGEQWRASGIDVALAAGGDGVVGGVITHIAASGLPLGILPLGTSNDTARALDIPLDLAEAAAVIAAGKEVSIDIGVGQPAQQAPHRATSHPKGPVSPQIASQKHAYFAHASTVGLNVQFARLATNVATRKRFGRLTYPIAAIEVLSQFNPIQMNLTFEGIATPRQSTAGSTQTGEGMPLTCKALQVAVINAPIFGGRWRFAIPDAAVDDHLLDIVVFEAADIVKNLGMTFVHLLDPHRQESHLDGPTRHLPTDMSRLPGIHHIQARAVTLTTAADPQDVTLDGEVRGQTPALVRVSSEQLRVIVAR